MKDPKLTVRLTDEELKQFKVKIAQKGTTVQAVLKRAVDTFLKAPRGQILSDR